MSVYGHGAYAAAKIIDRSGQEHSLWTVERPFLQSVSAEENMGDIGVLGAVIAMPLKDGLELLADPNILVQGNRLMVKMGYSADGGSSTPWFDGILRSPEVQISASGVSITLAADGGHVVAFTRTTDKTYKGKPLDVLREVATDYGWKLEVDAHEPETVESVVSFSPGDGSTWTQIWTLMNDNGYVLTGTLRRASGGEACLKVTPVAKGARIAKRTFVMFGSVDQDKRQYPIVSFSADASPMYLYMGAAGFTSSYIGEDGQQHTVTSDPTTSTEQHAGDSVVAPSGQETKVGDVVVDLALGATVKDTALPQQIPHTRGPDETTAGQVQTTSDRKAEVAGFTVTVSTVGIPEMSGNDDHLVAGVGIYDGYYTVKSWTMQVDSGGFTGEWTGIKKSIDGLTGFRAVPKAVPDTLAEAGQETPP
ncbi:hypothetical protein UFOVP1382_149 [uncultured Caudovirales phage]|uniref:Uncharacterized protein n=1 Tax=uncultured Caudovirales phage TaxID=2100421 RepID=A0A6J5S0P8_9CAUD|nr:hypothetical protein UFOVP1382_149 [uncultured Caudovirales phage]